MARGEKSRQNANEGAIKGIPIRCLICNRDIFESVRPEMDIVCSKCVLVLCAKPRGYVDGKKESLESWAERQRCRN